MVVNRLILRSNGVVVADIDVAARRRASAAIPSLEGDGPATEAKRDDPPSDSDSKMPIPRAESPDSDSELSELSESPGTPHEYKSLTERLRGHEPKPSPRTWRRTSHVVSGRVTKDTPVVGTKKPKFKIVSKWARHLKYRLPPFSVAREITFPRELTPTKPRRHSVPHSMP
ncbi:hypothetical protein KJ359_006340 [Pestalotiopsis sp. 9143b]|nr:hypothetical protein KJ359_006340 [Pestalotiopsis sp. 9143b]